MYLWVCIYLFAKLCAFFTSRLQVPWKYKPYFFCNVLALAKCLLYFGQINLGSLFTWREQVRQCLPHSFQEMEGNNYTWNLIFSFLLYIQIWRDATDEVGVEYKGNGIGHLLSHAHKDSRSYKLRFMSQYLKKNFFILGTW